MALRSSTGLVAGALALTALSALACSSSYEEEPVTQDRPVVTRVPAQPKPEPKPAAPESALVRTLYKDDWFGGVRLLGIDAANMRAVVRVESQAPARIAIDTIDLRTGQRIERWLAEGKQAEKAMRSSSFTALSGTLEEDVSRFAKVLGDLGPWHLRSALSAPTFAVAPKRKHVLWGSSPTDGSEGDWLFATSESGAKAKRVDQGLVASYSPVFSPDGDSLAFIGCSSSPCDYGLFVTKMGDDKPRRVAGIQRARAPMWSATGDAVLTVGARAAEQCLFRAPTSSVTPRSVACVKGLEDVNFAQDPIGRTAAVAGVRGVPGQQVVDITWLLLADGTVLGTHTVDRAVGSSVLSESGLMALPMQRGAVGAVDLVTGTSTIIPESEGWFFGFEGARWIGDTLIVLRKTPDVKGYEIVAIDIRKASGRREEKWL